MSAYDLNAFNSPNFAPLVNGISHFCASSPCADPKRNTTFSWYRYCCELAGCPPTNEPGTLQVSQMCVAIVCLFIPRSTHILRFASVMSPHVGKYIIGYGLDLE